MVPLPCVWILVRATTALPERPGPSGDWQVGRQAKSPTGWRTGLVGGIRILLLMSFNVISPSVPPGFTNANGYTSLFITLFFLTLSPLNSTGKKGEIQTKFNGTRDITPAFEWINYDNICVTGWMWQSVQWEDWDFVGIGFAAAGLGWILERGRAVEDLIEAWRCCWLFWGLNLGERVRIGPAPRVCTPTVWVRLFILTSKTYICTTLAT